MKIAVVFDEPLHHVCLMYGLKQTYARMPFLSKRVGEFRGKLVLMDLAVTPPPTISNPNKKGMRTTGNLVGISYWKNHLSVEYWEDLCNENDIMTFVNYLIQDYLYFRHPFMKTDMSDGRCMELVTGHLVAEIVGGSGILS